MLGDHQPLNAATGAAHAAAWAGADGAIRLVREDVGRHNAFDTLIGAMRRADADWGGGVELLSWACSHERGQKGGVSDFPLPVTLSGPSRLARERKAASRGGGEGRG